MKKDNQDYNVKLTKLDEEIVHFDSVLEQIQERMPEDLRVYEAIVQARDYIFRLQQIMHGCEIVVFASGGNEGGDI